MNTDFRKIDSIPNTQDLCTNNLATICDYRAKHTPDKIAYRFLKNGIDNKISISYLELSQRARIIAQRLQYAEHTENGALLLYPAGIDYICAFLGCLYAGITAIPAYPLLSAADTHRLESIIVNSQARAILTNSDQINSINTWTRSKRHISSQVNVIETDKIECSNTSANESGFEASQNKLAFLQYTSGSTGNPKGVMLSHDNLIHNLQQIYICFNHSQDSVGMIWLPPYHDMGLIGGILQPLYGGFEVNLMSPMSFLRRPLRWLQAITKYSATTSGGPNFAYEACIQAIQKRPDQELDLSNWDCAFTGAEPIRKKTLDRFHASFKKFGFQKSSFLTCYGLAESTLMVTGSRLNPETSVIRVQSDALANNKIELLERETEGHSLVSSGVRRDQDISIVDPVSLQTVQDSNIGEIWVAGSSVAHGYWKNKYDTRAYFEAYTESGEGPFLRTGDLGTIINKNLYVTGRLKEVIIVNGRNYYPNDLEDHIQSAFTEIRTGAGVIFSIPGDPVEELVCVQEVNRSTAKDLDILQLIKSIKSSIFRQFGLLLNDVILLKQSTLPKTTSGKLKRVETKRQYLLKAFSGAVISTSTQEYEKLPPIKTQTYIHPLMGLKVVNNVNENQYERHFTASEIPYLLHHKVNGEVLIPASGYLEIASFLGREYFGLGCFSVKKLSISSPFRVQQDSKNQLITHTTRKRDELDFVIQQNCGHSGKIDIARGTILKKELERPSNSNIGLRLFANNKTLQASSPVDRFYNDMLQRGFDYGESFRLIKDIRTHKNTVYAHIQSELSSQESAYIIHPTILDACLQSIATLDDVAQSSDSFIPVSFSDVSVFDSSKSDIFCEIKASKPSKGSKVIGVSIKVYNEESSPVIFIDELRLVRVRVDNMGARQRAGSA